MLKIVSIKVALTLESQHPPHIGFRVSSLEDMPEGFEILSHRDGTSYVYQEDPDGNVFELIYYPDDQLD